MYECGLREQSMILGLLLIETIYTQLVTNSIIFYSLIKQNQSGMFLT